MLALEPIDKKCASCGNNFQANENVDCSICPECRKGRDDAMPDDSIQANPEAQINSATDVSVNHYEKVSSTNWFVPALIVITIIIIYTVYIGQGARISDHTYINKDAGFMIDIPEGWVESDTSLFFTPPNTDAEFIYNPPTDPTVFYSLGIINIKGAVFNALYDELEKSVTSQGAKLVKKDKKNVDGFTILILQFEWRGRFVASNFMLGNEEIVEFDIQGSDEKRELVEKTANKIVGSVTRL